MSTADRVHTAVSNVYHRHTQCTLFTLMSPLETVRNVHSIVYSSSFQNCSFYDLLQIQRELLTLTCTPDRVRFVHSTVCYRYSKNYSL